MMEINKAMDIEHAVTKQFAFVVAVTYMFKLESCNHACAVIFLPVPAVTIATMSCNTYTFTKLEDV